MKWACVRVCEWEKEREIGFFRTWKLNLDCGSVERDFSFVILCPSLSMFCLNQCYTDIHIHTMRMQEKMGGRISISVTLFLTWNAQWVICNFFVFVKITISEKIRFNVQETILWKISLENTSISSLNYFIFYEIQVMINIKLTNSQSLSGYFSLNQQFLTCSTWEIWRGTPLIFHLLNFISSLLFFPLKPI